MMNKDEAKGAAPGCEKTLMHVLDNNNKKTAIFWGFIQIIQIQSSILNKKYIFI